MHICNEGTDYDLRKYAKRGSFMKKKQKLEDLNVLNDFLLSAIANDPDVAEPFFRDVLSVLLEREIGEVTVRAQMVIPGDNLRLRGIRMDVEILEEDNSPAKCRIYNLESQMYEEDNFCFHACEHGCFCNGGMAV